MTSGENLLGDLKRMTALKSSLTADVLPENRRRLEGRGPASSCRSLTRTPRTTSPWQPCTPTASAGTFLEKEEPVSGQEGRLDGGGVYLLTFTLCSLRASGWSQKPTGAEPDHDHPECALGARGGSSEGIQSHLRSCRRRSREHGRTGRS